MADIILFLAAAGMAVFAVYLYFGLYQHLYREETRNENRQKPRDTRGFLRIRRKLGDSGRN